MLKIAKLIGIGIIAGIVLIIVLKVVQVATGNDAYILLFNFDYIPVIKELEPVWLYRYVFHFVTCIASVVILYYLLKLVHLEMHLIVYIIVYTVGGGLLYFLTALSDQPPEANDTMAWFYWTSAHAVFSLVVGILIKKWIIPMREVL